MGFSFKFFGTQEVRKFSYKPRFYDPEKEELGKNQKIIGVITTILLFAVIFLIYKYFPILIDSLTK